MASPTVLAFCRAKVCFFLLHMNLALLEYVSFGLNINKNLLPFTLYFEKKLCPQLITTSPSSRMNPADVCHGNHQFSRVCHKIWHSAPQISPPAQFLYGETQIKTC